MTGPRYSPLHVTELYGEMLGKFKVGRARLIKFEISRDVETNPGPVDGSKTIKAPCSQDNVTLFGLNAGSQCVAMSVTALIYNHRNTIVSSRDLQNVMNIGNELYVYFLI